MSAYVPANLSAIGLEKYLHEKIPLTRPMAMHVARCDSERLVLEAPLDANSNHLGTAFGGSLHALPMLACYSVLWRVLKEGGVDGHVVVKRSSANYREPVQGLLRATCVCPSAELVAEFLADLRRHGKARMELSAAVDGANGKSAVQFEGSFVALVSELEPEPTL